MTVAVVLCNPKTPFNVGSAIRACSIFDVPTLRWTGKRISTAEGRQRAGSAPKGNRPRLPREERMKDSSASSRTSPRSAAWCRSRSSYDFVHPWNALYVFGPEDGSIPRGVLAVCHRFVRIPSANRTPLNLAAALNVVLYDRYAKALRATPVPSESAATLVA